MCQPDPEAVRYLFLRTRSFHWPQPFAVEVQRKDIPPAIMSHDVMDLFSGNTLGLYAFSRTLVFFATQFLKERFYLEGFSFQFLFAFAFSILEGGLFPVLVNGPEPASFENLSLSLLTFLLPRSFCTGLATPFLFFLFQKGMSLFISQPEQGIKARG